MPPIPTDASVTHHHTQAQNDTYASTQCSLGPVEAHIVRIPSTRANLIHDHTLSSRMPLNTTHGHTSSSRQPTGIHHSHISNSPTESERSTEYITRKLSRLTTFHTPTSSSHGLKKDEAIVRESYTRLSRVKIDAIEQGDPKQIARAKNFETVLERSLRSRRYRSHHQCSCDSPLRLRCHPSSHRFPQFSSYPG